MKQVRVRLMLVPVLIAALLLAGPAAAADQVASAEVMRTSNVLGIPLMPGKVHIAIAFLTFAATLGTSSKDGLIFTSNYKNLTIDPDTGRESGIIIGLGETSLKGSFEPG